MSATTTSGAAKVFVFPAYAAEAGMAGEHRVECVVPDYLADLSPGDVLTVLERHAARIAPDGHDHAPVGGRLLRAMGRMGDGQCPTGRDITPEARDAALSDAIREFHGDGRFAPRYVPSGRSVPHAEYVAHLLGR